MLCLVLITTGMAGKALARYMTSTNNSDTAYVATFEINTNLNAPEATLNLSGIKPGMSQSVTLTVSNTSEVSVYYKFQFLPITISPWNSPLRNPARERCFWAGRKTPRTR